jgi:hypothetical protein
MYIAANRPRVAAVVAGIVLLSGCGGNGLPVASSSGGASPQSRALARPATTGDLLYVANKRASEGIDVLTFPQGSLLATIRDIGTVATTCSDTSGSVWIATFRKGSHPFYLYKFRHGATKPVETRFTRRGLSGCAVDPTTGNLAVVSYDGSSDGAVDVWPGARKGKPVTFFTSFAPAGCAYDDSGDLFVDGIGGVGVALAELVKGGKNFTYITLGKNSGWTVSNVQWDGTYVALAASTKSGSASIYRIQVSAERGKLVQMVHLQNLASWPHFVIANSQIVATQSGPVVRKIGLYNYPAGGKALDVFSGFDGPHGLAISVKPK